LAEPGAVRRFGNQSQQFTDCFEREGRAIEAPDYPNVLKKPFHPDRSTYILSTSREQQSRSRQSITISLRKRTMKHEEQARRIEQIVAKAWIDEVFRYRLLSDPARLLRAEGVPIPQGVEVRILEDTDSVRHVVLPMKPSIEELTEEQVRIHSRPA
jgi:Nitrile hydratase, alpha chain